ncbi:MAG: TRAM domain-containing protein, partial [Telluria sp.]
SKKDPAQLQGRCENNRVVHVSGGADGAALVGQLVDVRITASHDYFLRGELAANLHTLAQAS